MYLLPYLQEAEKMSSEVYELRVDYRLACSGEFYNRAASAGSWRSLEKTRLLLQQPFELYVVSRPFNAFPQELCLRFGLNLIWEHQSGGGSIGRTPDYDDLVEDVCAVLTVLSRRLVVPVFEARVLARIESTSPRSDSFGYDSPSPIIGMGNLGSRVLRTSRAEGVGGAVTIVEHTPPPLGVDSNTLQGAFLALSRSQYAAGIVQAARAYSSALQLILSRPELAYQLLISSVETVANILFADFLPSREDMIERKRGVAAKAALFGLSKQMAEDLAVEACKEDHWAGRKFKKFFAKFPSEEAWGPDDVFPLADGWEPKKEDFAKVLGAVYNARSKHLHEGKEFPEWITRGATVAVPASFHTLPRASDYVPPVTWFERLVSCTLRCLLAGEMKTTSEEAFLQA
jgi:hypothetical protein